MAPTGTFSDASTSRWWRRGDSIPRRWLPCGARKLGTIFAAGVVIAVLLTIPFVNLLAPLVATAAMVHLFERMRGHA